MTKLEKNANEDLIRAYVYDAPAQLSENPSGTLIKISTESSPNFINYYFTGDLLAVREEDGSDEPLASDKEEIVKIVSVDKVNFTITIDTPLVNTYTKPNARVYIILKSELYKSGLDKNVTIVELWKNE